MQQCIVPPSAAKRVWWEPRAPALQITMIRLDKTEQIERSTESTVEFMISETIELSSRAWAVSNISSTPGLHPGALSIRFKNSSHPSSSEVMSAELAGRLVAHVLGGWRCQRRFGAESVLSDDWLSALSRDNERTFILYLHYIPSINGLKLSLKTYHVPCTGLNPVRNTLRSQQRELSW